MAAKKTPRKAQEIVFDTFDARFVCDRPRSYLSRAGWQRSFGDDPRIVGAKRKPKRQQSKKQGQPKPRVQPNKISTTQQSSPTEAAVSKEASDHSVGQAVQKKQQIKVQTQQNIQVQKKVIVVAPNGQRKFVGQPKVFKPAHNNLVYNFKLKGASQAFVSGNTYTVYRNNYRRRYNGRFYTFVALGLLTPLAIGAAVYYPYAYLNVPANYCEGLTEDGCEMVYREVETVEGDLIPQCAAYCPWQ